MRSKRLRATTATILAGLSTFDPHSSGVWAQSKQAACPTSWAWASNSLGQDPCRISSFLDAKCRGTSSFSVPALNASQNYEPPQRGNAADLRCDCDTVTYSLYMGCTACQNGKVYAWTKWAAQCDNPHVAEYSLEIPKGTAIPHWAYFNITTLPGQIFDSNVAMAVGQNPEVTPTGGGKLSGKKIGAIAGGAVGGVGFIIAIVIAVVYCMRRRKRGGLGEDQRPLPPPQPFYPEIMEHHKEQPASPPPPTATPASAGFSNYYYNPDDPTTFPPPLSDGQSSFTYVNTLAPLRGPQN